MQIKEPPKYVLDAQTKAGDRMTSFALDIPSALLDFQDWIEQLGIKEANKLWYVDVFDFYPQKHIATVTLNDKGLAVITPAPANSKVKMFKRNKFIARLKGELR